MILGYIGEVLRLGAPENHGFPGEKSAILTNVTRRPRSHDSTALKLHHCRSLHTNPHGLERRGVRIPSVQRSIGSRSPGSLDPERDPSPHRPMERWKLNSPDIPHRSPGHSHRLEFFSSFCDNALVRFPCEQGEEQHSKPGFSD